LCELWNSALHDWNGNGTKLSLPLGATCGSCTSADPAKSRGKRRATWLSGATGVLGSRIRQRRVFNWHVAPAGNSERVGTDVAYTVLWADFTKTFSKQGMSQGCIAAWLGPALSHSIERSSACGRSEKYSTRHGVTITNALLSRDASMGCVWEYTLCGDSVHSFRDVIHVS
jgi:hypothetical protein